MIPRTLGYNLEVLLDQILNGDYETVVSGFDRKRTKLSPIFFSLKIINSIFEELLSTYFNSGT